MKKMEIIIVGGLFVAVIFLFIIIGLQQSTINKYKMLCDGYQQQISTYKMMVAGYDHALNLNEQIEEIHSGEHTITGTKAIVKYKDKSYYYIYNSSSTAVPTDFALDGSPPKVISPDKGPGRWIRGEKND